MAPEWLVVFALGGALVALWLSRVFGASRRSRVARQRGRAAVRGEDRAEELLEQSGFRIVDRQVRTSYTLAFDDEPLEIDLRLDFVVERDGEEWVAEVKTGTEAPQISTAATRRQLLEYAHARGTDRVLLVDAERGEIVEVVFAGRLSGDVGSESQAAGMRGI